MKKILLVFVLLSTLMSCSNELTEAFSGVSQQRTCQMYMNGTVMGYDDDCGSRASVTLSNGTVMYVTFPNDVKGQAVYKDGVWTVTYNGIVEPGKCSAYCFIGSNSGSVGEYVVLDNVPGYGTTDGTCSIASNGDIMLTAELKPLFSRIRFKGEPNTEISSELYFEIPYRFSIATSEVFYKSHNYSHSTRADGYTPYFYYSEPVGSKIELNVNGKVFVAEQFIPQVTGSYVVALPTESNHSGWELYVTVYADPMAETRLAKLDADLAAIQYDMESLEVEIENMNKDFLENKCNVYVADYNGVISDLRNSLQQIMAEDARIRSGKFHSIEEMNARIDACEAALSVLYSDTDFVSYALSYKSPLTFVYDQHSGYVSIDPSTLPSSTDVYYCYDVPFEKVIEDERIFNKKYNEPFYLAGTHVVWTKISARKLSFISRFDIP